MVDPVTTFDGRFSEPDATATPWAAVREVVDEAGIYWLTTVRADGRPHVTPLLAVWLDGSLHFGTGPDEQKARNLENNPCCALTTGCNDYRSGLDAVIEGTAVRVTETARLQRLADAWTAKYGDDWQYEVAGDVLTHQGGTVLVFEVAAAKALAFSRGPYSQTSYRF